MTKILTPLQDNFLQVFFLDKAGYTVADNFEAAQKKDGGLVWESLTYNMGHFWR